MMTMEIPELKTLLAIIETVINEKQISAETLTSLSKAYDTYRDAVLFEDKLKGHSEYERKTWLTATEAVVLRLRIAEGKSYAEIATDLDIAEITVRNHLGKAMRKLGHYDKRKAVLARVEAFGSQQVKEKFRLLLFA